MARGDGCWRAPTCQTYEGASIRTPIHRRVLLDRHQINPPDFEALRTEAYASPDVMLRDTPDGFRYLKRSDKGKPETGHGEPATGNRPLETGDRVLAGRADRLDRLADRARSHVVERRGDHWTPPSLVLVLAPP